MLALDYRLHGLSVTATAAVTLLCTVGCCAAVSAGPPTALPVRPTSPLSACRTINSIRHYHDYYHSTMGSV